MKLIRLMFAITAAMSLALIACSGSKTSAAATTDNTAAATDEPGQFSADSAMAYASRQVEFGPRVPGTAAHAACRDWLVNTLRTAGADSVAILRSQATAWDGTHLDVQNIFATFNAAAPTGILVLAHYDTRPWADSETDPTLRDTPIDGANDGASGVAVILEIARNLGLRPADVRVDLLLTDCEDYGVRSDAPASGDEDSWAIGARRFAEHLPYSSAMPAPRFGILLDMVGGRGARFNREYFSVTEAQKPTAKIWAMADRMGLADRFPMAVGGAITDDHLPLIRAGIPTADIIESANPATGSFPATWHTHEDNLSNLDPATMLAVGRVVLNVIYHEK